MHKIKSIPGLIWVLMIVIVLLFVDRVHANEPGPDVHEKVEQHAESHDESHSAAHHIPSWGEIVWPLTLRYLNLFIFMGLLYVLLRKPMQNFLEQRRKTVSEAIDSAQERKSWAEREFAAYHKRLENISSEIAVLNASLEKEGKMESEKIAKQALALAETIRRDAALMAEADWEEMKDDLRRQAIERAVDIARESLSRIMDEGDRKRFNQEFLQALSQSEKFGRGGQV